MGGEEDVGGEREGGGGGHGGGESGFREGSGVEGGRGEEGGKSRSAGSGLVEVALKPEIPSREGPGEKKRLRTARAEKGVQICSLGWWLEGRKERARREVEW